MTIDLVSSVVEHGSVTDEELVELGLRRADVLDLSSNLHPVGPSAEVLAAVRAADVSHYPDPGSEPLRSLLAAHHELSADEVLVTAGATAAIHLALRTLLSAGDRCVIFSPTFGEYEAAVRHVGATVVDHRAVGPAFEPPRVPEAVDVVVLCNPNNPTGRYLTRPEVESVAARTGGTLLLDVAYDAFVNRPWDADALVREGASVLVVHSMTKLHAVPGLRLGYVTGPRALIARLEAAQPSWPVGAPAIAAGVAALEGDAERRSGLAGLAAARARLRAAFTGAGIECAPSEANFILARVGDAAGFRTRLIRSDGIVVRDATSFGLPDWVRVAVPSDLELPRVIAAIEAALAGRPA